MPAPRPTKQAYRDLARYQRALDSSRPPQRPSANAAAPAPLSTRRGDQAAAAIEADLDRFHSKLDALLDLLEDKQPAVKDKPSPAASSTTAVVSAVSESSAAGQDDRRGTDERAPGSRDGQGRT